MMHRARWVFRAFGIYLMRAGSNGPTLERLHVSLKKCVLFKILIASKDFNYNKLNNIVNIFILKKIYCKYFIFNRGSSIVPLIFFGYEITIS